MKQGDYIGLPLGDNLFQVVKILRIDSHPKMGETFHCMTFDPVSDLPSLESFRMLKLAAYHVPMDGSSIRENGKVLFNMPVSGTDLFGFYEYLKEVDFARFIKETEQNIDDLIEKAKMHYFKGNDLADHHQYEEAIEEYSKAIHNCPVLFQAIDNRGLTYMDLGQIDKAMEDFNLSLSKNPDNYVPFFSLGECHLKKGNIEEAKRIFSEGIKRWPNQEVFKKFLKMAEKQMVRKKPWWKIF